MIALFSQQTSVQIFFFFFFFFFFHFRTSRPSAHNQSGLMTHSFARASGEIVTVWKGHGAKGSSTLSHKLSLHYFPKVTGNINKTTARKHRHPPCLGGRVPLLCVTQSVHVRAARWGAELPAGSAVMLCVNF